MPSPPAGGGGVTVAEVNLKFVWEVVIAIRVGEAGLPTSSTADGRADRASGHQPGAAEDRPDAAAAGQLRVPRAQPTTRSVPVARDLQGREVLTAHARIPTLDWTVFVELPLAEALAPLYATIVRTGILLLAA